MRDKSLFCKYKGLTNRSSQIRASFSDDTTLIISGSEDRQCYIWTTDPEYGNAQPVSNATSGAANTGPSSLSALGQSSASLSAQLGSLMGTSRRDRNNRYECFQVSPYQIVTGAVIAPRKTVERLIQAGLRPPLMMPSDDQKQGGGVKRLFVNMNGNHRKSVEELNSLDVSVNSNTNDASKTTTSTSISSVGSSLLNATTTAGPSSLSDVMRQAGRIFLCADHAGVIHVYENDRIQPSANPNLAVIKSMDNLKGSMSSLEVGGTSSDD